MRRTIWPILLLGAVITVGLWLSFRHATQKSARIVIKGNIADISEIQDVRTYAQQPYDPYFLRVNYFTTILIPSMESVSARSFVK